MATNTVQENARINDFDKDHGEILYREALPNDPLALQHILSVEKQNRQLLPNGNFADHLVTLHENLLTHEAQRITKAMQLTRYSHDENYYTVEIAQTFLAITDKKDIEQLCSLLPYKSLSLTSKTDGYQTRCYIHADKDEVHELRKQTLYNRNAIELPAYSVNKEKSTKTTAKKSQNRHGDKMTPER